MNYVTDLGTFNPYAVYGPPTSQDSKRARWDLPNEVVVTTSGGVVTFEGDYDRARTEVETYLLKVCLRQPYAVDEVEQQARAAAALGFTAREIAVLAFSAGAFAAEILEDTDGIDALYQDSADALLQFSGFIQDELQRRGATLDSPLFLPPEVK